MNRRAMAAAMPLATMMLGASAPAGKPVLTVVGALQPGAWEVAEEGGSARRFCLRDGVDMVQLRHPGADCTRTVVQNDAQEGTVHYSCPGAGQGRTTVRAVTPRSVLIESQGIAGGQVFHFNAEGRRLGACGPGGAIR